MARPVKKRRICALPEIAELTPVPEPGGGRPPRGEVVLHLDEYETLRLIDCEGFTQTRCAAQMQISRATAARLYESARRKVSCALVEGRRLRIAGGDVTLCGELNPHCASVLHCPRRGANFEQFEKSGGRV